MECPLWRLLMSSRSVSKHGHHMQFLFLIGWYLKFFCCETFGQMNRNLVGSIYDGSGRNEQSLQRTFHRCFLPSFTSFGKAVSEEKFFRNRPIRNKNCLWWPCLLMDRDEMCFLNSSSLRPFGQMNRNLVRSIYGRSSVKIGNFFPIC
jgi:hypothetical protein